MFQWGVEESTDDDPEIFYFLESFPNRCIAVVFSIPAVGERYTDHFTVNRIDAYENLEFSYIAVGY